MYGLYEEQQREKLPDKDSEDKCKGEIKLRRTTKEKVKFITKNEDFDKQCVAILIVKSSGDQILITVAALLHGRPRENGRGCGRLIVVGCLKQLDGTAR